MRLETLCLHAGQAPDPATGARAVPIYRTTAYQFNSTEHASNLFALKEPGNIYTRMMNPTHDVLEKRVAALEGGAAGLALSSGTSAIFYAVLAICQTGDEIVSATNLYGGTFTMFNDIFPQFGIKCHFADSNVPGSIAGKITDRTKLVFVETIGNPALDVTDLESAAEAAHAHGIPLIVDSTFTPPCLLKPLEHGADIVIHSLTKWLGGHGTGIGGIVVDSGRFNWRTGKFPLLSEPDASYHNLRYTEDFGENNHLAYLIRMRVVLLRNLGACISPDNAFAFLQGIETLALRMERHCSNAFAVARFLEKHPQVGWVRYPGLEEHPTHDTAVKYLKNGFGGMVVFGIRGGSASGSRFIESLKLFSHLANVGDAKSLAIHPASTTHSQLTEEQQLAGGITPDLVRLSIGLEHIDDILEDLDQAIAAAK